MEIVKNGKDISIFCQCDACGCQFRYLPAEIQIEEHLLYDAPPEYCDYNGGRCHPVGHKYFRFVICPQCKTKIDLDERRV